MIDRLRRNFSQVKVDDIKVELGLSYLFKIDKDWDNSNFYENNCYCPNYHVYCPNFIDFKLAIK